MSTPTRTRRTRGSGTVYPRKDGRAGWIARIPVNGREEKRSFATEEEGLAWLDSRAPLSVRLAKAGDGTLGSWLQQWLLNPGTRRYRRRGAKTVSSITGNKGQLVSDKTRATYRSLVQRHWLTHAISKRPLGAVTTQDVMKVLDEWDDAGVLGKTTIGHLRRILSAAYTAAAENGLVAANPVMATGFRSVDPNRVHQLRLSEDVAERVEAAAKGTSMWTLITVMLNTGLRLGEALALHWEDVQITVDPLVPGGPKEPGYIWVRRALVQSQERGRTEWFIGEPKTQLSKRQVWLDQDVVAPLFQAYRHDGEPKRGLVFHAIGDRTRPLNPQSVSKQFAALMAEHGIELEIGRPSDKPKSVLTIRDLRSLHASLLVQRGWDIAKVSKRLGHSDSATTWRRYISVPTKADREAARESGLYQRRRVAVAPAQGTPSRGRQRNRGAGGPDSPLAAD